METNQLMLSTSQTIRILHHDDPDGRVSAYWILKLIKHNYPNNPVVVQKANYNDPISSFNIGEEPEIIYIVDFSLPIDDFSVLVLKKHRIIWIDHHITAINKYAQEFPFIPGLRSKEFAGCELSYLYYQSNIGHKGISKIIPPLLSMEDRNAIVNLEKGLLIANWTQEEIKYLNEQIPYLTHELGLYDSWRFPKKLTSLYEGYGLAFNMLPKDPTKLSVIEDDDEMEAFLADTSNTLLKFVNEQEQQIKDSGFEVEVDGVLGFAYNHIFAGSMWASDTFKKYDFLWRFAFKKDHFSNSIYSKPNSIHAGEFASRFGGGGHAGAAGFQTPQIAAFNYRRA